MTGHWVSHLLGASRLMAILLSLRILPFAVHGVLTTTAGRRLAWAAAYLVAPTCAWMLGGPRSIAAIGGGCAYYLMIGLGINRLSRLLADGQLTKGALAIVLLWFCLLLPGLVLPGLSLDLYLVVGMELALSAYSYCAETSRRGSSTPPLGDALFFLLVNPTLVYSARGAFTGTTAPASGLRRAAAGIALMSLSVLCLRPLSLYLHGAAEAETKTLGALVVLVACGAAHFLVVYAAHSGLASIQIGLMRHAGWTVPERYNHPLRSASPADFWRRWNTYRRVWLEAYVFLPFARRLGRPTQWRPVLVVAAVATLLASGLMHDAYAFAGRQRISFRMSELFLAAGALLVLWRCAAFIGAVIRPRRGVLRAPEPASFGVQSLSRAMLAAAVIKAAIVWA